MEGDIAAKLLGGVLAHPRVKRLLSTDHFSVDGTLIEAPSVGHPAVLPGPWVAQSIAVYTRMCVSFRSAAKRAKLANRYPTLLRAKPVERRRRK